MLRFLQRQSVRVPELNPLLALQAILGTPISRRPASIFACWRPICRRSKQRLMSFTKSSAREAAAQGLSAHQAAGAAARRARQLTVNFLMRAARLYRASTSPSTAAGRSWQPSWPSPSGTIRPIKRRRRGGARHASRARVVPLPRRRDRSDGAPMLMAEVDVGTLNAYIAWLNRRPIGKGSRHTAWSSSTSSSPGSSGTVPTLSRVASSCRSTRARVRMRRPSPARRSQGGA